MSALSIDSVNVPVRAVGGASKSREWLGRSARSQGGYLRSDDRLGRGVVWNIETPPLAGATISTVRTALETVGSVTADGTLLDSTATPCMIRGLTETPTIDGYSVFRFQLHVIATT